MGRLRGQCSLLVVLPFQKMSDDSLKCGKEIVPVNRKDALDSAKYNLALGSRNNGLGLRFPRIDELRGRLDIYRHELTEATNISSLGPAVCQHTNYRHGVRLTRRSPG